MRLFWRRESTAQRDARKRLCVSRHIAARLEGWQLPLCPECGNRNNQCHVLEVDELGRNRSIVTIACSACGWTDGSTDAHDMVGYYDR